MNSRHHTNWGLACLALLIPRLERGVIPFSVDFFLIRVLVWLEFRGFFKTHNNNRYLPNVYIYIQTFNSKSS